MLKLYDISGIWNFNLDGQKLGLLKNKFKSLGYFNDTIHLPSTTACEKKGDINNNMELGFLTEEYKFEGFAWFSKTINIVEDLKDKCVKLFLERTRKTIVWINNYQLEEQDSLSAPHIYDISNYVTTGENNIIIMVNNTDYVTAGGHMTSPDTQTNWNGITGRMEVQIFNSCHIESVKTYPNVDEKSVELKIKFSQPTDATIKVGAKTKSLDIDNSKDIIEMQSFNIITDEDNIATVTLNLGDNAQLWSEYNPVIYELIIIFNGEITNTSFGLREFSTDEHNFYINGVKTLLRGKHDGMIFPLTGYAPTTVDEWVKVFKISKSYGINHYRFHTCCPPDEAFTGADLVGIYLQPEINFWGTLAGIGEDGYKEDEQNFLIEEGFRIIDTYGNHPSFVMFSLGNELWGSKERMNDILKNYKSIDNRHLYTQGSNNFQWYPCIVEEDDFFSGVRFSVDRQIRGSYAMCDKPLGHVQTMRPSASINYDNSIFPNESVKSNANAVDENGYIKIQYGTGMKLIKADELGKEFVPNVPVVSHEVGQYETFPNFHEIEKYTGVLKPRNLEIFKKRLEDKGMLHLADKFFQASGKLAVECYKSELESAFRSKYIAGFQLLDIQDFTGQGTALVGILDAFMDSKGIVSAKEWRSFCSDAILLGEFDKYVYQSKEEFNSNVLLSYYNPEPLENKSVTWQLLDGDAIIEEGIISIPFHSIGLSRLGSINISMPKTESPLKLTFKLFIEDTNIEKHYNLMVYPNSDVDVHISKVENVSITTDLEATVEKLSKGEKVLFMPNEVKEKIQGFYCTDFWCYPMFRSISESMGREIPVGTMGLLIDNSHKSLAKFPSEFYSTPQWYNIITHSDCAILDDTPKDFFPIVQMIDNFERNHKLGILFECSVGDGKLLVSTSRLLEISQEPEVKQYFTSLIDYMLSNDFNPAQKLDVETLKRVF
ncbi:MAG: sugar-binding domain-containing protein [Oscillospiraceae bacterium]